MFVAQVRYGVKDFLRRGANKLFCGGLAGVGLCRWKDSTQPVKRLSRRDVVGGDGQDAPPHHTRFVVLLAVVIVALASNVTAAGVYAALYLKGDIFLRPREVESPLAARMKQMLRLRRGDRGRTCDLREHLLFQGFAPCALFFFGKDACSISLFRRRRWHRLFLRQPLRDFGQFGFL